MIPAQAKIAEQYQQRQKLFLSQAEEQRKSYSRLSWARLSIFILAIAIIILIWTKVWWIGLLSCLVFIGLFARFIRWHSAFLNRAKLLENKALINAQEIKSLQANHQDFISGEQFVDGYHPYSFDLDVFLKLLKIEV